jgi:hypothetical protein
MRVYRPKTRSFSLICRRPTGPNTTEVVAVEVGRFANDKKLSETIKHGERPAGVPADDIIIAIVETSAASDKIRLYRSMELDK